MASLLSRLPFPIDLLLLPHLKAATLGVLASIWHMRHQKLGRGFDKIDHLAVKSLQTDRDKMLRLVVDLMMPMRFRRKQLDSMARVGHGVLDHTLEQSMPRRAG